MAPPFPGGISDKDRTVAYLNVGGELLAVDLTSGGLKWRQSDDVEPIASSDRFLVTRRDLPAEPVIELRDAQGGEILARLTAAKMPGFDEVSTGDPIEAEVDETPSGLEIRWQSERRYRGGAVPSAFAAKATNSHGAVLLDVATGRAHALPSRAPSSEQHRPEALSGDPTTIAAMRSGSLTFAMKQQHGKLLLEACNARGELLWETVLGNAGEARAEPLRE